MQLAARKMSSIMHISHNKRRSAKIVRILLELKELNRFLWGINTAKVLTLYPNYYYGNSNENIISEFTYCFLFYLKKHWTVF